jgi:hypothetical protein
MPTVDTLQAITDAFNRHDLDAIMAFFAVVTRKDFWKIVEQS